MIVCSESKQKFVSQHFQIKIILTFFIIKFLQFFVSITFDHNNFNPKCLRQQYGSGFFESDVPAKTGRRHWGYMSVLQCVIGKITSFPSLFPLPYTKVTPSLSNVVTYPHCFLTAYKKPMTTVHFRCDDGFKKIRPILFCSLLPIVLPIQTGTGLVFFKIFSS